LTVLSVTMVGIGVVAWLAWPWLPIAPEATGTSRLVMVALLALIFVGMARLLLDIIYGAPPSEPDRTPEPMLMVAGPVALALIVLFLGLYIPGPLQAVLVSAAGGLGGAAP
jgi:formate hydrogenlyase subunit 3/multisubunit Na+/H+ antiporter MnhD subunit